MNADKFFVFDVESAGLHGEGFAVGFVVVDREGNKLDEGLFVAPVNSASGNESGFQWLKENLPAMITTHDSPWLVRAAFWRRWLEWQEKKAVMVADCAWPVEARFLIACVNDRPVEREWQGPYPLHDLASIILAHGGDPLANRERNKDEFPSHNPLCDARQSARLLVEHLNLIKK